MKKLIALGLSLVMAASVLAGCGAKEAKTTKVIEIELTQEEYAFGVDKTQPELLEKTNAFIAEIKANGTFDEICDHYFGDGTPVKVTSAALDESKDQLVVATNAAFEPFEYTEGDSYLGIARVSLTASTMWWKTTSVMLPILKPSRSFRRTMTTLITRYSGAVICRPSTSVT